MKKVLILTLPVGRNYGGTIQAYALYRTIASLGLRPTLAIPYDGITSWSLGSAKDLLIRARGGVRPARPLPAISNYISQNTRGFVKSHIDSIRLYKYSPRRNATAAKKYTSFVVGSDQVWRGDWLLPFFMFNFAPDGQGIKKMSYAASFGVSKPTFGNRTIKATKALINSFSGISVREYDGVNLCNNYWGAQADVHVDPTLLIDPKEYNILIDSAKTTSRNEKICTYVLDRSSKKNLITKQLEDFLGKTSFEILPKDYDSIFRFIKFRSNYMMPPIEQWLRDFRDSEYVVTDSFHGTVFSIIFNKPFITIGNNTRGMARFTTLLKLFSLEDRLIFNTDDVTPELLNKKIDWNKVNRIIKKERKRSFDYLATHLGGSLEQKS